MAPYHTTTELEHIYLEDSFVLEVTAIPGFVEIVMDAVLTEEHPLYAPPKPDEYYCFRVARLRFHGVRSLTWQYEGIRPALDASGEADYGGIDEFDVAEGRCSLAGDFGQLEIECAGFEFFIEPEST